MPKPGENEGGVPVLSASRDNDGRLTELPLKSPSNLYGKKETTGGSGHDQSELQLPSGDARSGTDRFQSRRDYQLDHGRHHAFSVEGAPLGLLDVRWWARNGEERWELQFRLVVS